MPSHPQYAVSAIVSTYNSERFMRGCLEDLVRQTLFSNTEIIVVDACSPQGESAIVREFQEQYDNIVLVRTPVREGLYASWNRAARLARGRYLTNANTDDRHHPQCFERLAAALDANPRAAVAYADVRITDRENAVFEEAPLTGHHFWRPYDHLNLLRRCEVGPQPMWRAGLHAELGYFDEALRVVGDLEFWLRVSEKHPLLHLPEELGLYLDYAGNLETANRQATYEEERPVKERAIRRFLAPSFTWREPLPLLLSRHAKAISDLIAQVQQDQSIADRNTFDHHFFAYCLIAAKLGDLQAAKDVLALYFDIVNDSKNLCTLYRVLLCNDPVRPGLRARAVPAVLEPPLVSVVVPLYNQGAYLEESLASVLAQTQPRWEMCIVNDGSTDTSLHTAKELLARYDDPRIRLVSQANAGKGPTRNRGVRETAAPYVCVLDADDILVPTYFETAVSLLQNDPEIGWIIPQTLVFGANNHVTWNWDYDFFASLLQCPCPVTAVFRRDIWDELGGYREDMTDREDWEFWVRAGEAGWRGRVSLEPLFIYRHAFVRAGTRPRSNLKSKLEYLALHPWWFKHLPPAELTKLLTIYSVGILPSTVLDETAVETVRPHRMDRAAMRCAVEALKAQTPSRGAS